MQFITKIVWKAKNYRDVVIYNVNEMFKNNKNTLLLTKNGCKIKHLSKNTAFRRYCPSIAYHWPKIIHISRYCHRYNIPKKFKRYI